MTQPLPTMPETFWNAERLAEFWYFVKWFMQYNMPIFMMIIAVIVAGMVLFMVIDIPLWARKEQGRKDRDDDELDVEYY